MTTETVRRCRFCRRPIGKDAPSGEQRVAGHCEGTGGNPDCDWCMPCVLERTAQAKGKAKGEPGA